MEVLFLIIIIAGFVGYIAYQDKQYKKTAYYQVTQNPYSSVKYDKGRHGEYLTYKRLQHFESRGGRFLFNIYIPKRNNETTEIDMLLICSKGLFVFESKNYSGWIFGNERNRNWTQTLPIGRGRSHKERFYNPVMQNATHIKHLGRVVLDNIPMRSIIVFSDNCTLKDITINSEVRVINCYEVASCVDEIYNQAADFLTPIEIDSLYNQLYPYTQVSCEEREQHTNNIQGF
jgi:hypothetical protein